VSRVARALLAVIAVALLCGCGSDAEDLANPPGATVQDFDLESRAVGRDMPVRFLVPGGRPRLRPMLVFLHGRGDDADTYADESLLEVLDDLGDRAPVVALPHGGGDSYWHDRAGGDWARYVMDEVIPQVAALGGGDRDRVAIGGISMGGFGAYDLARLHPDRFCAVGGHSPALWRTAGETAPGAFDDAEDFARHDVIAGAEALAGIPVWLDAGDRDPFLPGDEAFLAALEAAGADVTAHTWPGGHDRDYWDRHWEDYLEFYADELERC
jgi:S-formylglutathione hydrolase FrmB